MKARKHTAVLCNRATFTKIPANLHGMLMILYDDECRQSTDQFAKFFKHDIEKKPTFVNLVGKPAESLA